MRQLTFDEMIDRYEEAVADGHWRKVDVLQFAPPPSDADHWSSVVELLRIRMEHAFADNDFSGLEACLREFPELTKHADLLSQLAYEDYRLRCALGTDVDRAQYEDKWAINTSQWDSSSSERQLTQADWDRAMHQELHAVHSNRVSTSTSGTNSSRSARENISRKARLVCGDTFGSFRILCELGAGALARVYLAQQLDLSGRPVVLKVCSRPTLEPQKIALLQHPSIVQIFSVHDVAGYQVLCMPYAGATTVADLLEHRSDDPDQAALARHRTAQRLVTTLNNRQREVQTLVDDQQVQNSPNPLRIHHGSRWPERWETMDYQSIVVELLLQIAEGLEHAHRQGIIHSDLKPANLLIGDDGRARLVDFNVSQSSDASLSPRDRRTLIGGTLPYMSPEHLQSLRDDQWRAGPASDLFSLGIIAYEMLCGQLPFEPLNGPFESVIQRSIDQRNAGITKRLDRVDASIDLQSIVYRLLEPDLNKRYTSATQVVEDLRRHVHRLPLKHVANRSISERLWKWSCRHPRLTSASSVAIVSLIAIAACLGAIGVYSNRLHQAQGLAFMERFRQEAPQSLAMATSYGIFNGLEDASTESAKRLLSLIDNGDENSEHKTSIHTDLTSSERLEIAQHLKEVVAALRSSELLLPAASEPTTASSELKKLSEQLESRAADLTNSAGAKAKDFTTPAIVSAVQAYRQGDNQRAKEQLLSLIRDTKWQPSAWMLLGNLYTLEGDATQADQAYASSLAIQPAQWAGWYSRGMITLASAQQSLRRDQFQQAADYFARALDIQPSLTAASFNRALCREKLGDLSGALADADSVAASGRYTVRAELLRARLLKGLGRNDESLAAMKRAFEATPQDAQDFSELGYVKLNSDPQQAQAALISALDKDPRNSKVLQNLAYLTTEVKVQRDLATQILDRWVEQDKASATAIATRGVFHARNGDLDQAISDAQRAAKLSPTALDRLRIASVYALSSAKVSANKADTAKDSLDPKVAEQFNSQAKQADEWKRLAYSELSIALQLQWNLVGLIAKDPDLASLQEDDRFQKLVQAGGAFGTQLKALQSSDR